MNTTRAMTQEDEHYDEYTLQMLRSIDEDIRLYPEKLVPLTQERMNRLLELVGDVDLDEPLTEDND
jgi:hypothetical protein